MKNIITPKLLIIFCIVIPSIMAVATENAKSIIEKSEIVVKGDTQTAEIGITIKTRRWTRTMTMISYADRINKKSFAEITSPVKDAGNRFLLIDKNMWQYNPKLQQTIKISPSMMMQSWMGSDMSNDDVVKESSIIEDYNHTLDGIEEKNGEECYKLSLMPKSTSAVVWGKIIYYARKSDYLPVYQEFYDEKFSLVKFASCEKFKSMGGRLIPTLYKYQSVEKPEEYTLMEIKKIKFNTQIPAKIFSLQNLQGK